MKTFADSPSAQLAWKRWPSSMNLTEWISIAIASDGSRIIAGSNASGPLYISTDGGSSWSDTGLPKGNWLTVKISSSGQKIIAGEQYSGSMYGSKDGGVTWAPLGIANHYWKRIVTSSDCVHIAAVSSGAPGDNTDIQRIWISHDSGATWMATIPISGQYPFAAISENGMRVLAIGNGGGYAISTDGGASWKSAPNPGNLESMGFTSADGLQVFGFSSFTTNNMMTSTDGGITWASKNYVGHFMANFATSPAGKIIAFIDSALYVSMDAGGTWNRQTSAGVGPWAAGVDTMSVSGDGTHFAAVNWGDRTLLTTVPGTPVLAADTNYHWTEAMPDALYSRSSPLVLSNDGQKIAAAVRPITQSQGNIVITRDGGKTWSQVLVAYSGSGSGLTMSGDGNSIAVSSANLNDAKTGLNTYLYSSSDGGVNWRSSLLGTDVYPLQSLVSSGDGHSVYAIFDLSNVAPLNTTAYLSQDSGVHWAPGATTPFPGRGPGSPRSLVESADGKKLFATDENCSFYSSQDSGASWKLSATFSGCNTTEIAISADGTKILVSAGAVHLSTDGGMTWSTIPSANANTAAMSADGNKMAIASSNSGYIYTTADGGVHWSQEFNAGNRSWTSLSMSADGSTIAAMTDYGGMIIGKH